VTTDCPNCHSAEDHHVVWGPRNVLAAFINAFNSAVLMRLWPFVSFKRIMTPARPLRRKCLKCGYTFLGAQPESPNFDECAQCGYNLTGNVSGRCPECGWRLPRRFRAHRRLVDRALRSRRL
jgi:hypothetical protein